MDQAAWNAEGSEWVSPEFASSFHDRVKPIEGHHHGSFPEQSPPSYGSVLSASLSSPAVPSPRSPIVSGHAASSYFPGTSQTLENQSSANFPYDSTTDQSFDLPQSGDLWNNYLAWDLHGASAPVQPWNAVQDNLPPVAFQSWSQVGVCDARVAPFSPAFSNSTLSRGKPLGNSSISPRSIGPFETYDSPISSTSLGMQFTTSTDPSTMSSSSHQVSPTPAVTQQSHENFKTSSQQAPKEYQAGSTWQFDGDAVDASRNAALPIAAKHGKSRSPAHIPKTTPAMSFKSGKQRSQTAHKAVEKRYRTNLNAKIAELRDCIPTLRVASTSDKDGANDMDDPQSSGNAQNYKKGVVLSKAADYIQSLEDRNKTLEDQVALLQRRLNALQKIALAKALQTNPRTLPEDCLDSLSTSDDISGGSFDHVSMPQNAGSGTNIESSLRRREVTATNPSESSAAAQAQGAKGSTEDLPRRRGNGSGTMSKLMVGSLAGLAVMDGYRQDNSFTNAPNSQGLFALPFELIAGVVQHLGVQQQPYIISAGLLSQRTLLTSFRTLLIVGALLYIVVPSFFDARPKKVDEQATGIATAMSKPLVSSSLESRRNAWLTAIQKVGGPSNTFGSELAALSLKTAKVVLRNLLGWQNYSYLMGLTSDDEFARIAAWDVAIEAQLAGGDAEISIRRLLLTWMASTTLPETPGRLSLKAIHLQIIMREALITGYGRWIGLESLGARLSTYYWTRARKLQQSKDSQLRPGNFISSEVLPDHLFELINQDFNDVFVDPVIQRGYLLAFNKPMNNVNVAADEGMDQVIQDVEIRTALDALSAWWSSLTLRKALIRSLEKPRKSDRNIINHGVQLALKSAPPGSGAEMRALAAQAVFSTDDRKTLINKAIAAVPLHAAINETPGENFARSIFIKPEMAALCTSSVRVSLRCAMIKALGENDRPRDLQTIPRDMLIEFVSLSLRSEDISLLGFASAYHLLSRLFEDRALVSKMPIEIEKLAAASRLLVGSSWARQRGLSSRIVGSCVETCLEICKEISGARDYCSEDEGYSSLGRIRKDDS